MGGKDENWFKIRRISKAERETGVLKNEDLEWHEREITRYLSVSRQCTPRVTPFPSLLSMVEVDHPVQRRLPRHFARYNVEIQRVIKATVRPFGCLKYSLSGRRANAWLSCLAVSLT